MPSARELHDEIIRLSALPDGGADQRVVLDALASQLFMRLSEAPGELDGLLEEKGLRDALLALPPGVAYARNNVQLTWDPDRALWQWPPETFAAYRALLERHVRHLRVLGDGWCMSQLAHPRLGGGLLVTGAPDERVTRRVSWAEEGKRVRCLLGATWNEVNDFLDVDQRYNLANQPGFGGLTVAGNIGTGGHGSSLEQGPLSSMVTRIQLGPIDPGGASTVLARNDASFDYAATHLGRLGPVVAVDLEVSCRFRILEDRKVRRLGSGGGRWQDELQALVTKAVDFHKESDAHSAEIWIAPYVDGGKELVVAYGTRRWRDRKTRVGGGSRPPALRSRAMQTLGEAAARLAARTNVEVVGALLRSAVKMTETTDAVMEAREGLDFGAPNDNPMVAIEMAMDISDRVDATPIVAVIEKLEELASRHLFVLAPMGVRFVGQGPAHGLSPHQGRARTMHIEVPTFAYNNAFHGDRVLPDIQHLLARMGGRPHWGQRIYLDTAALSALWPAGEISAMARFVCERDGRGVFANELLDPLLQLAP